MWDLFLIEALKIPLNTGTTQGIENISQIHTTVPSLILFSQLQMHLPSQCLIKTDLEPLEPHAADLDLDYPLHLLLHSHPALDSLHPLSLHLLSMPLDPG